MSSAANALAGSSSARTGFYDSTIGKKVVMAITGVILFGFVIGHMLGNLQVFLGAEKLDAYAHTLKTIPALLWGTRTVLLISLILHVTAAIQLSLLNRKARPREYAKKQNIASSYASRTMMWSGPILFVFIVYHLLHFTGGQVHPDFRDGQVYHNVISGFQQIPVSLVYIVGMVMLGFHLYHGVWSMFQSLGIHHPRYTPWLRRFAAVSAIIIAAGNISMPLAVMLGILH